METNTVRKFVSEVLVVLSLSGWKINFSFHQLNYLIFGAVSQVEWLSYNTLKIRKRATEIIFLKAI